MLHIVKLSDVGSVLDLNAFERQNKAEGLGMVSEEGTSEYGLLLLPVTQYLNTLPYRQLRLHCLFYNLTFSQFQFVVYSVCTCECLSVPVCGCQVAGMFSLKCVSSVRAVTSHALVTALC